MDRNPIEANPVTRFLLGLAVVFAMMIGATLAANLLAAIGVAYSAWIGTGIGAVAVFVAFVAWYTRYDARASARVAERDSP